MVIGGLLFYTMPWFESQPSNAYILHKYSTGLYPVHLTEAAALLDLDLSDGKIHHQQCHVLPSNGVVPVRHSTSSSSSCKEAGVRVQLQCLVQHRDKDNKGKPELLTKIAEEKDGNVLVGAGSHGVGRVAGGGSPGCQHCCHNQGRAVGCLFGNTGHVQVNVTSAPDCQDIVVTDGPSEGTFSNHSDLSYGKGHHGGHHGGHHKKKKSKNDVRIDLFDPPSQEKESTATVSYESDLYINLCEAQV